MLFNRYIRFTLLLLLLALLLGVLGAMAFIYPEGFSKVLPFQQLRPMHVSSALFWIISGAVVCLLYFSNQVWPIDAASSGLIRMFIRVWMVTILVIFIFYGRQQYGGREYWEFPVWLSLPILISWLLLMAGYLRSWLRIPDKKPMYLIMWATGMLFFALTFIEQNLWHIPWFRSSYIRELTVQWKANGAMVGAWNQMIYGTSLYLMVKISGNKEIALSRTVKIFYFLSLSNLMFNWGHHVYNVPSAGWIRHTAYAISMTEWAFFIKMIHDFLTGLDAHRKMKHIITYRFLSASERWLFVNLVLAIGMSIPAINRYTHGTHITVAHAMGTTIGINSMILLGSLGYMLQVDQFSLRDKKLLSAGYYMLNYSLALFWLCLVAAGIVKGYRSAGPAVNFQEMMQPVMKIMSVLPVAGLGVAIGMGIIAVVYWRHASKVKASFAQKVVNKTEI